MKAKGNKEPDLHIARNKSVQNSNHGHAGLRKKHNLNVNMTLRDICLQQVLVSSCVINLDFNAKMCT